MITKSMKYYLKKVTLCGALLAAGVTALLSSCREDIDESNLYTFTGETIEDYLVNRSEQYSMFHQILTRIGYDKILAAYGTYTCFAPGNEAMQNYIDSLYDDMSNKDLPHNGMTQRSLEGLTDSLCRDIALFHLINTKVFSVNMGNGMTIRTILGRDLNTRLDTISHNVVINRDAEIRSGGMDIELENGILHEINHVITRSNSLIGGELASLKGFEIFTAALTQTGLMDSLSLESKTGYEVPTNTFNFYVPEECQMGFTIMAESDEVMRANGINSIDELIAYANQVYGRSTVAKDATTKEGWYDYYRNHGIEVSTGNDYSEANNALNMFVRYHILKCKVPYDKLVYAYNEASGMTRFEYYETLLPYTLLKVTNITGKRLINRWIANNTLTDRTGTTGTSGMHTVMPGKEGIEIVNNQTAAKNGYIHPINGMLTYDWDVPNGVLNERLRFDDASLFGEMMSNSFRQIKDSVVNAMNGGKKGSDGGLGGDYIRIPSGYFDNLVIYNGEDTRLYYLSGQVNGWSNYQGDEFNCMGSYDFAMRLPPVPDGTYELRLGYTAESARGMLQFYLGSSSELTSMRALDIPLDMRIIPADNNDGTPDVQTGWCDPAKTDDQGVSTDISMRNLGYMRGPLFYKLGTQGKQARYHNKDLRRILVKGQFSQGEYWLRFKNVLEDDKAQFHLDYIELCPENVYNNTVYVEDMY